MDFSEICDSLAERWPPWSERIRLLEFTESRRARPADNDGRGILYNEELMRYLTDEDRRFYIARELLHLQLNHFARRGDRDERLWRKAGDAVVNAMLREEGFALPMNAILPPDDAEQSAEALLQGWFTTQVQQYLTEHGRRIIGWDELLGCDVNTSATIMSWRGAEPGAEGAKLGHDVIMTPVGPLYFDYYQTSKTWNEPMAFGGCNTLKKVYDFEPVAADLPADKRSHIIGVQANVWTEYITCEPQIQYQVLPRMAALAEVQWLPSEQKDYQDFKARLPRLAEIYKHYGWTYRAKSLVHEEDEDQPNQ